MYFIKIDIGHWDNLGSSMLEAIKDKSDCMVFGEKESRTVSIRENTPYDTIVVDICHYTFVRTYGMNDTESKP